MNDMPPDDASDEVDDLYRRAAVLDQSRPTESTRRSILDHAARIAAESATQHKPIDIITARRAPRRTRRFAIIGTLAAAVLAGLVVIPRLWRPPEPPAKESLQSSATANLVPPPAAPAAPAPAVTANNAQHSALGEASAGLSSVTVTAQKAAPSPQPAQPAQAASAPRAEELAQLDMALLQSHSNAAYDARRESPLIQGRQRVDSTVALRLAAQAGDINALNRALGESADVNGHDQAGRTALMLAILQGQGGAVDVLLAHGADPNAADSMGTTPLQAAKDRADPSIVSALQRAGANE